MHQERCAIAKMTARCALYNMVALKFDLPIQKTIP